jgi:hypothetical protein
MGEVDRGVTWRGVGVRSSEERGLVPRGKERRGKGRPCGRDAGVGTSCCGGSEEERASGCGILQQRVNRRYGVVKGLEQLRG